MPSCSDMMLLQTLYLAYTHFDMVTKRVKYRTATNMQRSVLLYSHLMSYYYTSLSNGSRKFADFS